MHYLVTGKEMRLLDQNTSEIFHVPELVLMEQAAMAFVQRLLLIQKEKQKQVRTVTIVCGCKNNGADGLAIGRLLFQRGYEVQLVLVGEHPTESYLVQKDICLAYGIPMRQEVSFDETDLLIDAVFGIGLSRDISGRFAEVISRMNAQDCWKVSVDISSGISASNGSVMGTAFCAEDTITFSFGKIGQFLWPGNEYSGTVHVVPMGITLESMQGKKPAVCVLDEEDLSCFPERKAHSHKGTYGQLLVIAGDIDMAGAACLCAKAAYRMGAGLVKVMTPCENRQALQSYIPEAVLCTYNVEDIDIYYQTKEALSQADAVVIGPGIGKKEHAKQMLKAVFDFCRKPCVMDADALNLIAESPESFSLKEWTRGGLILTPHMGEMSRLTGKPVSELSASLCDEAAAYAKDNQVVLVLKDFHTITALPAGNLYCNLLGNPGMATAGCGDVLAGIIGSLLAQGYSPEFAASYGVAYHGHLGDLAKKRVGMNALMAGDLLNGDIYGK